MIWHWITGRKGATDMATGGDLRSTWGGEALGEARKGQCAFTVIIGGWGKGGDREGARGRGTEDFSFHFDPAR